MIREINLRKAFASRESTGTDLGYSIRDHDGGEGGAPGENAALDGGKLIGQENTLEAGTAIKECGF